MTLRDYVTQHPRYVRPLVSSLILPFLLFQRLRVVFALLLLPKCMASLFYHCPWPPARELGSWQKQRGNAFNLKRSINFEDYRSLTN